MERIAEKIRTVPDFPHQGIVFRDITPLLADPATLKLAIAALIAPFANEHIDAVAGMDARGFIFGSLAAWELDVGFIPLRKLGKLPHHVQQASYELEYGSAALEIHTDAVARGDRVLLVDDLIATGGTAAAGCKLIEDLGGEVVACAFLIELDDLLGRAKLADRRVHVLLHY